MKKRSIVFQYACLILICCTYALQAKGQSSNLFFQNYTTASGLCNNSINSITQDSRGFIWIGTAEGLSRFDGTNFRNFFASRDSMLSFPLNSINNLKEYKPGHLLFLSGGNLWCLNTITGTFYKPSTPLTNLYITRFENIPGNRFLFSSGDDAWISDSNLVIIQKIHSPFPASSPAQFRASFISGDTILLSGNSRYYFHFLKTGTSSPFIPETKFSETQQITNFQQYDKKTNSLYFSNFWHGLLQYNMHGKTIQQYSTQSPPGKKLSTNQIMTVADINDSTLYIGTSIGINILDKRTGNIREISYQSNTGNTERNNTVLCFYKDREGNTWTGTTEGISRINNINSIIRNINLPYGASGYSECYKISEGNNNDIYISLYGLGTFRINKADNSLTPIDRSVVPYTWSNLVSNDLLYMSGAGQKKLAGYNTRTKKIQAISFLDPYYKDADLVTLVYKDSHGDEWFSINQGGGLVRKQAGTNITEQYSRRSGTPNFSLGYAAYATEDKDGNSWFALNKTDLLARWDHKKGSFSEVSLDTVQGSNRYINSGVFYIYSGGSDTLWVSYESLGLVAYDIQKNKVRVLSIEDGLPTNYIYSIVADNEKRIWLGTRKGLVCYLPAEEKFITFRKENGLPVEEFINNAIYFDKKDNELWISSNNLMLRMNPDKLLEQNKKTISIYLDEVSINGKRMDPSVAYSLKHFENNFQFQFTGTDISGGNELEFAYQLKGADANWIYSSDKRSAIYSSLQPGNYTFMVRTKRKGDTEWVLIQHPFIFTIATPWWQTWWFILAMIAVSTALVILAVRSYFKRRLEKQRTILEKQQAVEKERTRIATDMHDDFGASLSRIKFLSEKLQFEKNDTKKMNEDLGKISAYSDEMAEKMGEIVWALNQRYDSSGDLVSFCRSYASEYLEDKSIKLHFESRETADIKIKGEVRRNIFLVMKEALHNIVKHAKATDVHISILCENELEVVIQDNGKGFDASSVRPFANGLENMKKRVEEIGGVILIENKNGTRISIRVNAGIQQNTYIQ